MSDIRLALAEEELTDVEDFTARTCLHAACECPVSGEHVFCCDQCKDASNTAIKSCPCGHLKCVGPLHREVAEVTTRLG